MTTTRAGAIYLSLAARAFRSGLLAASLLVAHAATADEAAKSTKFTRAVFEQERASLDVRKMADWVVHSGDNSTGDEVKLPFVILDKKDARVYVFDPAGRLRGAAAALLGMGRGDTALPGLGARELSAIAPKDRITQAGRFVAVLGDDSHGQDVLWLDYDGGLAMHRVITSNPKERRAERLATPTPLDNRISWGCINLPVKFYEQVLQPAFVGSKGIVYVLPETKPIHAVFASYDVDDAVEQAKVAEQAPMQAASSPLRRVAAQAN